MGTAPGRLGGATGSLKNSLTFKTRVLNRCLKVNRLPSTLAAARTESARARTRGSLLDAAGAVFSEVGFRAATIREISRRAGANVAAVNYHFGDKDGLYAEVWRYSYHCALKKYPVRYGARADSSPPELLGAYVRSFLLRIFDQGRHAWFGKLISREMIEPTRALDRIVDEEIRPQLQYLGGIIAQLLGADPRSEAVQRTSLSVVSQCVFYHHCQPAIRRLQPKRKFDAKEIAAIADHITCFSIAALKELGKG